MVAAEPWEGVMVGEVMSELELGDDALSDGNRLCLTVRCTVIFNPLSPFSGGEYLANQMFTHYWGT